jgi:hypothetical protein
MFVRFRQTGTRLRVSLVETHRIDGRVRQSYIASLWAIRVPPSPADRLVFWTTLYQRLAALGNRVPGKALGPILAAVHARIPMPTGNDRQVVQLEHAKADASLWESLHDARSAQIADGKALIASMTRDVAAAEAAAAETATKAQAARERLAKAERGEDAGPVPPPMTREETVRMLDWGPGDILHACRLLEIEQRGGTSELVKEIMKRRRQTEKAAARAVRRRHRSAP